MSAVSVAEHVRKMKLDAPAFAATSEAVRNEALELVAVRLQESKEAIFAANAADLADANANGIAQAVISRLKFDEHKLADCIAGIEQLVTLPDPIGQVQLQRELDEGLVLRRVSCPLGVVGVIFEARPDALVQIASLCIKSGNCAVLKGGKETHNTNTALFQVIYEAALQAGLPKGCLLQASQHDEIDELLACDEEVDLLIPRGSNKFVRYIMDNTKIPVMGHSSGICHIYVDAAADLQMAPALIIDAKIQYPAACNAVETLLVSREIAPEFLPVMADAFARAGVKMRGSTAASEYVECEPMDLDEFATEYGDLTISVHVVDGVKEAVEHINKYGSHHTDCILTQDEKAAEYFMQMVDSAGVYVNASTRFADGFRYGLGAEVGISTGKTHARGPVGLEGLTTYKYRLLGQGQIVGDYASGKSAFHFRDF